VAGCALAGGFLLDFLGGGQPPMAMAHHGWMLPPSVEYVSAVILFIVLGFAIMQRRQTDE
jgi:phosphotransferase system  glucose/maltose/N-acetylglucosamine-specific IIC component